MVGHQYEHPFSPGESPSYYIDTDLENCEEKMRGETTGKSTWKTSTNTFYNISALTSQGITNRSKKIERRLLIIKITPSNGDCLKQGIYTNQGMW